MGQGETIFSTQPSQQLAEHHSELTGETR
jgi:hypothetical protein